MYQNRRILGLIPARGGSKGIPHKNIINLCGKPLIAYTIEAGRGSKYIDELIVSTDDEEIAKISKYFGANVPFMRPAEFATDTSATIEAITHAITTLKENGSVFDVLILLQPTQPLRTAEDIDEALEKYMECGSLPLVSVNAVDDHPILIRSINKEDRLVPLLEGSSTCRRQDMPEFYRVNGCIYINDMNNIDVNTSFNDNVVPYVMQKNHSVDIDDLSDLALAEFYIKNNAQNERFRYGNTPRGIKNMTKDFLELYNSFSELITENNPILAQKANTPSFLCSIEHAALHFSECILEDLDMISQLSKYKHRYADGIIRSICEQVIEFVYIYENPDMLPFYFGNGNDNDNNGAEANEVGALINDVADNITNDATDEIDSDVMDDINVDPVRSLRELGGDRRYPQGRNIKRMASAIGEVADRDDGQMPLYKAYELISTIYHNSYLEDLGDDIDEIEGFKPDKNMQDLVLLVVISKFMEIYQEIVDRHKIEVSNT